MFDQFTAGTSRRDVLKASAVGVGASLGLVGTAGASEHVVEFDEPITITPEDSGKTFVQTADFEGRVRIRPGVENVTVDGNGYTISDGGVGGGSYDEGDITDLTLQNLHLADDGFNFEEIIGLFVRNNVVEDLFLEAAFDVRVLDNTFSRAVQTDENFGGSVFARNVTPGFDFSSDFSGSHRISNNVVTGGRRSGVGIQEVSAAAEKIEILDNYVGNADGPGIAQEGGASSIEIHRNIVVANDDHGLVADGADDVRGNAFVGNGGDGVNGSVQTFRNNVAVSNDGDGFRLTLSDDGDCLRNAAISNGGAGFRIRSRGAEVKFNCSTGNDGDGVVLDRATGLSVRKNSVTSNGGDGLVLEGATGNGVSRNRICGNDGEELVVGDDASDNRFANNLVC